jgi:hypothetical protein
VLIAACGNAVLDHIEMTSAGIVYASVLRIFMISVPPVCGKSAPIDRGHEHL